jgi:superfamily II DNA or RNA helicase
MATGRYIGEGFDDARLDTLFLTLPVSWRGTIQQYAGRLHRLYATKQHVAVVDYVDVHVSLLMKMYQRRLKGYAASGYAVPSVTDLLTRGGAGAASLGFLSSASFPGETSLSERAAASEQVMAAPAAPPSTSP